MKRPLSLLGLLALIAYSGAATDGRPRIVAVAPNVVELLFEVGCGGDVVGVGDWARWPPEVQTLPQIGGLFDPRLETIAALEPDLAVLLPSEAELGEQLEKLEIEVLTVPSESLGDIAAAATTIASRCGSHHQLEQFLGRWREALAPSDLGREQRVLIVVGRQPGSLTQLIGVGPGTFVHELLIRIGATNILADSAVRYPQVSLEELVARSPTLVIDLQGEELEARERAALARDWERLPGAPRVVILAAEYALIPGPRLPALYADLSRALEGDSP